MDEGGRGQHGMLAGKGLESRTCDLQSAIYSLPLRPHQLLEWRVVALLPSYRSTSTSATQMSISFCCTVR